MAKREGIMLAYLFDPKRFDKYPKPVLVQPKINGDRCRAVFNDKGKVTLLSSGCKERMSVPHIKEQLESLNLKNFELDGELYHHGMPHEDIRSIVSRTKYLHPMHKLMDYYIFDVVNDEGQTTRLAQYQGLLSKNPMPHLISVPYHYCYDLKEIELWYETYLQQGFEGIIIRHPYAKYKRAKCTNMMKLKPRLSNTYKIVGFTGEMTITGTPKDRLGALILEDEDGRRFHVGTGFTHKQREALWYQRDKLLGKTAKIRYQELSTNFIPKMASFEEIIN